MYDRYAAPLLVVAAGPYRYRDANGVETFVDHLEDVPPSLRDSAKAVTGEAQTGVPSTADSLRDTARVGQSQLRAVLEDGLGRLEAAAGRPTLVIGGLALGLFIVALGLRALLRRRFGRLFKLLFVAVVYGIMVAAYLSLARSSLGDSTALGTPQGIVEEAREAAEAVQRRSEEQLRRLEQIEGEKR